jgi:hypothetical protein
MDNITPYLKHETIPRNELEILELINSQEMESTIENWTM